MKKAAPKKPHARRKKGIFGIDDAEWDFSERTIPSESVHECLMYEYARELIRRSPTASSALKKLQQADYSGDRGLFWDSWEEMNSFFKTKSSGSVPVYQYMDELPWVRFQQQLEKEKQEMLKKRKTVRQPRSMSKGNSEALAPKTIKSDASESNEQLYWGHGLVLLKNPPFEPGRLFEIFSRSVRASNAVFDADVRRESCGFFAVDLKARIPDVLADFQSWLVQEKKRAGIVDSERRGRTSETDKAYKLLKALGAYRLMTMTKKSAERIIDTFHDRIKSPPLYSNPPEWSRAKKIVEAKLRNLFVIPADAIF